MIYIYMYIIFYLLYIYHIYIYCTRYSLAKIMFKWNFQISSLILQFDVFFFMFFKKENVKIYI